MDGFVDLSFALQFSSVAQLYVTLRPCGLQHARLPCPSPTPRACSNLCPLSQWCHPSVSSSVVPFSSCPQSFPASGSFPVSQFFASGGQSVGVSASVSVLPMNIQGWFPLGLTSLISLQCKGLSRVFSSTTVQKHQFFSTRLSLWSNSSGFLLCHKLQLCCHIQVHVPDAQWGQTNLNIKDWNREVYCRASKENGWLVPKKSPNCPRVSVKYF